MKKIPRQAFMWPIKKIWHPLEVKFSKTFVTFEASTANKTVLSTDKRTNIEISYFCKIEKQTSNQTAYMLSSKITEIKRYDKTLVVL
jgi:hypothetical protein